MLRSRSSSDTSWPTSSTICSNEMLISWPLSSLVAGVKIGSGNCRFRSGRRAGGCRTRCRVADIPSSRSRPGSRARRTRSARPASCGPASTGRTASRDRPTAATAIARHRSRHDGWARPTASNQNELSCVRTRPLSGMPVGKTQSKALIRSVATSNNLSPRSYTSRTLPRRTGTPWIDVSKTAEVVIVIPGPSEQL